MLAAMNCLLAVIVMMALCVISSEAFVGTTGFAPNQVTRNTAGAGFANVRRRAESKSALKMADVVVEFTKTGKTVNAVVGTPLSQMCAKAGVKVKYNCKQGDCATCTLNIDGRNVKACQGKVPSSRRIIKIKA